MPTITVLGLLPSGTYVSPTSVSADGSVVVGNADTVGGQRAFRWVGGVTTSLGLPTTGTGWTQSNAVAVSADGLTVVGSAWNGVDNFDWIWTAATGMVLDSAWGGLTSGNGVESASSTCAVKTGVSVAGIPWRSTGGVVTPLGLPTGIGSANSASVSADGNTVVCSMVPTGGTLPVRSYMWTLATGYVPLGIGSTMDSSGPIKATLVLSDGTAYGSARKLSTGRTILFKWTSVAGFTDLGTPFGAGASLVGPSCGIPGKVSGQNNLNDSYSYDGTAFTLASVEFPSVVGAMLTGMTATGGVVGYGYDAITSAAIGFNISYAAPVPTPRYFWTHASGMTQELPV